MPFPAEKCIFLQKNAVFDWKLHEGFWAQESRTPPNFHKTAAREASLQGAIQRRACTLSLSLSLSLYIYLSLSLARSIYLLHTCFLNCSLFVYLTSYQSIMLYAPPLSLSHSLYRTPKSIHQYCVTRSPSNTSKALWCSACIFSLLFPLKTSIWGIHQTSFWPVEALDFSELKTPLVYTFSPLIYISISLFFCLPLSLSLSLQLSRARKP